MYKIVTKDNVPLPEVNVIPLELIVHPDLSGDSIKLCAFIIREARHNFRSYFEKVKFQRLCGVKRRQTENAISQLIDLKVLSIYMHDGDAVYELDYTTLMNLLSEGRLNTIKNGHAQMMRNIREHDRAL